LRSLLGGAAQLLGDVAGEAEARSQEQRVQSNPAAITEPDAAQGRRIPFQRLDPARLDLQPSSMESFLVLALEHTSIHLKP